MKTLLAVLCCLLLASCSVTSKAGFDDVERAVLERTGKKTVWIQGQDEEQEVKKALSSLLSRELSADEAVQIALLNNQSLQEMYEELGVAEADVVQAGLLKNPIFSAERRFPGKALEIDIAQDFIDLFFIPLRKRIAETAYEAAKYRVTQHVLDKVAEVRSGYFTLQGSQQLLEVRRNAKEAALASLEAKKKLRAAGNIALLEVQNEANLLTEAELDLALAEQEVIEHREQLNVLMGLWGGETSNWSVPTRLPPLPSEDVSLAGLESRAISQRFDLLAAQKEFETTARSLGLSRYAQMFTEATISGHTERESDGSRSTGPSIALPIPIFDSGQAASSKARAMLRASERRFLALAISIRSEVRAEFTKMQIARHRSKYLFNDVLPLQVKIIDETQKFYNGMFLGISTLLEAKRRQISAGQSYVEALQTYWIARVELERAIGGGSVSALSVPQTAEEHAGSHSEVKP